MKHADQPERDADAADALLREQVLWLQGVARSLVPDEEAAKDLVQDVWLRVLRNPPPSNGAFRAWARVIMRRLAMQRFRSMRRRKAHEAAFARSYDGGHKGEPSTPSEETLLAQEIREAFRALSPALQEVVVLRYDRHLEPREIARRLGVPQATVRVRLKRAHDRLRDRFRRKERSIGERGRWLSVAAFLQRRLATRPVEVSASRRLALLIVGAIFAGSILILHHSSARAPRRAVLDPLSASKTMMLRRETSDGHARRSNRGATSGGQPAPSPVVPATWRRFGRFGPRVPGGLAPGCVPFDVADRFAVERYVMADHDVGLALVREPRSDSIWKRENWQLATITVIDSRGASEIRLVDGLNRVGIRNWGSVSLSPAGIVACYAEPGGNYESFLIEPRSLNSNPATLLPRPLIRGKLNPKTKQPESVTSASIVSVESERMTVVYLSDARVEVAHVPPSGTPHRTAIPMADFPGVGDVPSITRLSTLVTAADVQCFVELHSPRGTYVARFDVARDAIASPAAWRLVGIAANPGRTNPTKTARLPLPELWEMGLRTESVAAWDSLPIPSAGGAR